MRERRPGDDGFAGTAARAARPSPESGEDAPGAFPSTQFDPLADERQRASAQAALALDVCQPALALRVVLFVQALLAVAALAHAATPAAALARIATQAFGGVVATLVWLVAVCALRGGLLRAPAPVRWLGAGALGALAALGGWAPLAWTGVAAPAPAFAPLGVAVAGAAVAALVWSWLVLRAKTRLPADSTARLVELQARIRPHFLFNALNTALALLRVDPERAERVLEDLALLFRVALAPSGASVSLADEISLAARYLEIEQLRFGSRLRVQWEIDPRAGAARLPPLALQPLVENAVRHGVEPAPDGGSVWVRAAVQHGQAVVTVTNTVGDAPGAPGHGMALANLRERLGLLHDVAARCEAWREGGLFHARITVPL